MKFNYDKKADSLYINFKDTSGVDSYEISPDFIADIDSSGAMVGLEVLNVKDKIDINDIIFNKMPTQNINFING